MCAEKIQECPNNLAGFTPIPVITFEDDITKRSITMNLLSSDVESFPEDIKAGFCHGTLAGDEDVFFYHESVKARFTEFLKTKMPNIPSALFGTSAPVTSAGSVVAIDDAYWQSLTTKEDIEKMAGSPPSQLGQKDMFDSDWILLRNPLDGQLVAQLRAAMGDTENKIFRRGIVDNSYFVTADLDAVTRLNLLLYYVQIEMERSGKEPELLDAFGKKVVYEFSTYAFDILQKKEDEKKAWEREIIGWGAIAVIFGVIVTWLSGKVMGRGKMPDPFDPNGSRYRRLIEDMAERLRTDAKIVDITSRLDGGDAERPKPEGVIDFAERVRAKMESARTAETLGKAKRVGRWVRDAFRKARER